MDSLNLIYFSPTGTTKKIVKEIGREIGIAQVAEYDISTQKDFDLESCITDNNLTVIGMPCYAGRLPKVAADKLTKLHANNAPAIIVVVYGNRAYEDSLLELKNILINCGFNVIAAGAFIGEHSFSSASIPLAKGRPDKDDLLKCSEFSHIIRQKIQTLNSKSVDLENDIPGNYPYKQHPQFPLISPETNLDSCDKCKACVDICPTNAITINEKVVTNKELCIWCCACVKTCANNARLFNEPFIDGLKHKLNSICQERQEPEFIF